MAENVFEYLLTWILWLLAIFSFVIWFSQMTKIVFSNYIINIICLSFSNTLSLLILFLWTNPWWKFLAISFEKRNTFFENGQTTMVLILYGILITVVFTYSKIHISLPDNDMTSNIIQVVMIPMTVFSVIFSIQIAIFWDQIVSLESIGIIADKLTTNQQINNIIRLTPVRILIHSIIALRITTQIWIRFSSPKSNISIDSHSTTF